MIDTKKFFKTKIREYRPNQIEHSYREMCYLRPFREKYDIVTTDELLQMIDRIYEEPAGINYIAQQYNIEFDIEPAPEGKILVGNPYYSTADKMIHIGISTGTFIKIMNGEDKQEFIDSIDIPYVHENIHRQQDQGLNSTEGMKNYDNGGDLSTWKSIVSYLSQKDETDAFTAEIALDLINHNMKISEYISFLPKHLYVDYTRGSIKWYVEEFKDKLTGYKFVPSTLTTTAYFYLIGGETWRRFLSKLYTLVPERLRENFSVD